VLGLGLLPFFKLLSLAFILYSVAASLPKMSLSKKWKFDKECTVFQDIWSVSHFFTDVNGKPVCLVCSQQVSVVKEYNIRVFRKGCSLNVLNHLQISSNFLHWSYESSRTLSLLITRVATIAKPRQWLHIKRISRNNLFAQGNWFRVRQIFSPMRKLTMKQS